MQTSIPAQYPGPKYLQAAILLLTVSEPITHTICIDFH